MKKFYTLLAAAAVVLSATAAKQAPTFLAKNLKNDIQSELAIGKSSLQQRASALEEHASSRTIYTGVDEDYYWAFQYTYQHTNGNYYYGYLDDTDLTVDGTTVTFEDFGMRGVTITGTRTPLTNGGAFDAAYTFKSGQKSTIDVYDDNRNIIGTEDVYVFEYDQTTGEVVDFTMYYSSYYNEIYWEGDIDADAKSLSEMTSHLIFANGTDPKAAGYQEKERIYIIELLPFNAIQYITYYNASTGKYQTVAANPVYAEYDDDYEGEQYITVYNLFNGFVSSTSYEPVDFEYDPTTGKAVEYDQAWLNQDADAEYQYYIWTWNGDDKTVPNDPSYEMEVSYTELKDGSIAPVMMGGWCQLGTMSAMALKIQSTYWVLPYDVECPSGIANVSVDSNLPVEYYNLSGVRVKNPANGLYIRRQGDNVSKIYVK